MRRETRRRAVLGTILVGGVGTAGYLLRPRKRERARWLRPAEDLDDSELFAHVGGVTDGTTMNVEVAMRATDYDRRDIVLFADSNDPVEAAIPGLRSYWRFDAAVADRALGTYRLRVGEDTLSVELTDEVPDRLTEPTLELTPRGLWRATFFAYAHGYSTGPDTGHLTLSLRKPAGSFDQRLDAVAFRTPDGETVGRTEPKQGTTELSVALDPFDRFEADGRLVGLRDGERIDDVALFYH